MLTSSKEVDGCRPLIIGLLDSLGGGALTFGLNVVDCARLAAVSKGYVPGACVRPLLIST